MEGLKFIRLRDCPERMDTAASWFSRIWGIPAGLYQESMRACASRQTGIPQWYVLLGDEQTPVAGAGVIENDFHERTDLAPNVCALYVAPAYRGHGLARMLLDSIREDCAALGVQRLYLITEHMEFYEKCGWHFLTMVRGEDGALLRMYTAGTAADSVW